MRANFPDSNVKFCQTQNSMQFNLAYPCYTYIHIWCPRITFTIMSSPETSLNRVGTPAAISLFNEAVGLSCRWKWHCAVGYPPLHKSTLMRDDEVITFAWKHLTHPWPSSTDIHISNSHRQCYFVSRPVYKKKTFTSIDDLTADVQLSFTIGQSGVP